MNTEEHARLIKTVSNIATKLLLKEIINTFEANNLESIDRDWFKMKLKSLENE